MKNTKTLQQVINETREELKEKLKHYAEHVLYEDARGHEPDEGVINDFLSWHTSTFKAFIEAEMAYLEEMKKEISKRCDDYSEKLDEKICFDDGFSEAMEDQITHLKQIKL